MWKADFEIVFCFRNALEHIGLKSADCELFYDSNEYSPGDYTNIAKAFIRRMSDHGD